MDCAPACQICDQLPAFWDAFEEEHEEDETELITYGQFVRTDFGMAQHLGLEDPEEVALIVENSQRYLEELKLDPEFQDKVDGCRNHLRDCSYWAFQGECFNNPHYLDQHCAAACQTCDEIEIQPACLRDNYQPVMWEQPGELNQMFQRVATDPEFQKYSPNVLSGPQDENQGPWIVTLDDFLTQEECDALIQHGADQGYSKSMGIGEMNEDGTYSDAELTGRTSTNTWCDENSTDNPLIKGVIDRIEHLVQVPYSHAEFLQLLKYEPGQFYESHHDWSVNHLEEP
jgi:prolyl 4-hydroxylase